MSVQLKLQLLPIMNQDVIRAKIKEIDSHLEKLHAKEQALNDAKKALLSETAIQCSNCRIQSAIKDMTYIQTHWYTSPTGCNEGDYWNQGEGRCECPSCGCVMRLYEHPELEALKSLFKEIKDTYTR